MAWTQGTASNYLDLMDKLKDFISDPNPLGSQAWTINRWDAANRELIATGPGLAGLDQVVVGIKAFSDNTQDYYDWWINGFIGYNESSTFSAQPGAIINKMPIFPLWNKEIPYWFVVSGRRIIVIAKIGVNYEAMYLGLLQSYCPPGIFPYPLIVGGSMTGQLSNGFNYRWDNNTQDHRHFIAPGVSSGGNSESNYNDGSSYYPTSLRLRKIDGVWVCGVNYDSSGNPSPGKLLVWPYGQKLNTSSTAQIVEGQAANFDGSYPLFSAILMDNTPNAYGEFEGCYYIPGKGLSPEDIISVGSDQYLVVPNVYRTGPYDYWVLKLA